MNVFGLTRALVDIESITENESDVAVISVRPPWQDCGANGRARGANGS